MLESLSHTQTEEDNLIFRYFEVLASNFGTF